MRPIEIRLLEGPNVYRLEPAVKVELAVGRRRTWFGERDPAPYARVRLGAPVRRTDAPPPVAAVAAWVVRLHQLSGAGAWLAAEGRARTARSARIPVAIHRTSEPGHWIVAYPWREAGRAERIARAAIALTERGLEASSAGRVRRGAGARTVARAVASIAEASAEPPPWIRDADRRVPVIAISGTNGKTTTTRMIAHILRAGGRRVGMTTSDGVLVDEVLVERGDLTGPLGARSVLTRPDVDVAVLETARGGIVLRGVGYESNEAAILTNVSADHMDLQGLHTLPELAEVKGTIARMTRPDGVVVLNAQDRLVAALAREVRAEVRWFSLDPALPRVRRHLARGGSAVVLRDGAITLLAGATATPIVPVAEVPATLGGIARHNVANALAAAAGALAMGASADEVRAGLRTYEPTADQAPGRLNLYSDGRRVVIVDFAHNEAGLRVALDAALGLASAAGRRRRAPVTVIIGTAGDRPDDSLRAIGRVAATGADTVAIKETQHYLRGRTRESVVGELRAGIRAAGADPAAVPVYPDEAAAVRGQLAASGSRGDPGEPSLLLLMCHEDRDGVVEVLGESGFAPTDGAGAVAALA